MKKQPSKNYMDSLEHNIEVQKDDDIFNSFNSSNSNNPTSRHSKTLISDTMSSEVETHVEKILHMVDQTKFLQEEQEFTEKNKLREKQIELLDTFSKVEKGLYEYIDELNFLSINKKKDIKFMISEKLLNNYVALSENNLAFIKEIEKMLSIEYSLFSGNLDTIKSLETYFGFKLEYSKLDPDNCNSEKLLEQLQLMEDDLFLNFLIQIEMNMKIKNLPQFLTSTFKSLLREKLLKEWQMAYEIPMKKIKLKRDDSFNFLSAKFLDLINDKFNLFDFDVFSEGDRFLLFELLFYSSVSYIVSSEFSKQAFMNNLKKYIYLLGIQSHLEEIGILMTKYIVVSNEEDSK